MPQHNCWHLTLDSCCTVVGATSKMSRHVHIVLLRAPVLVLRLGSLAFQYFEWYVLLEPVPCTSIVNLIYDYEKWLNKTEILQFFLLSTSHCILFIGMYRQTNYIILNSACSWVNLTKVSCTAGSCFSCSLKIFRVFIVILIMLNYDFQ